MFDIGFWEIVLIAVVALLVVGPNEFPSLVRNVGRSIGKVKGFLSSVKSDLDYEIDKANELKSLMEKEAEIAKLHQLLEANSAKAHEESMPAEVTKVDKVDEHSQAESNPGTPQPLGDRSKAE